MKKISFKVTFLSDIILQASSNTEGKVDTLDFIPGSNFLGIVAKKYSSFTNPFEIFHSGKVRFGDATLLVEDNPTYKVPYSYYKPKIGEIKVENHHLIKEFSTDKQLKQIREGYLTKEGKVVTPEYTYSQKSAYDKKNRRSKDSTMYGYKAIKEGTTWMFHLSYTDDISIDDIVDKLEGKRQLGKSKSAQYGSVMIEKIQTPTENIEDTNTLENVVIYLNSRLALFDENGMPSYQPTAKNLGISEDSTILWDKCQIKTHSFSPYNGARKTKDYARIIIEKGSVIVLDKIKQEDIEKLKSGIGAFLSEGFGEVLINPVFTKELYPIYNKIELIKQKKEVQKTDTTLISFLENKKEQQKIIFAMSSDVQKFINKHKEKFSTVSKSQWGQIRSICMQDDSSDENIKEKVALFIDHGTSKKKWEKGESVFLQSINKNLDFTRLLSMQMPKQRFKEQTND